MYQTYTCTKCNHKNKRVENIVVSKRDKTSDPGLYILFFFFRLFIYLFLERGERREKEERNINVWLPLVCPLLGTWTAIQASALTENQTGDSLVCRPALNPLGHTSQGLDCIFLLGKTNYKKVNERMKR